AEGALDESHSILQRMRELVVQAGNTGTNEEADLKAIQDEIGQLQEELTGIANRTEFNGKTLLNGDFDADSDNSLVFQIGANATQQISVNIENMDADSLGTD
ncbi:flagellin, partial [Pseudomonas sp. 2588-5]